jgi:hypothetical protein
MHMIDSQHAHSHHDNTCSTLEFLVTFTVRANIFVRKVR